MRAAPENFAEFSSELLSVISGTLLGADFWDLYIYLKFCGISGCYGFGDS